MRAIWHLDKLARLASERELDGLLLSRPSNIFYATGFKGGSRLFVRPDSRATIMVGGVDLTAAEGHFSGTEVSVRHIRLGEKLDEVTLGLLRDGFNRLQASSRGKESEHQGIEREEKTIRGLIASVKEELEKLGGEEEELKARREGLLSERKSLELELRKERELLEEKKGFLEKEERGREEARLQRESCLLYTSPSPRDRG
mgnify:CR=1 FL=1